MTDTERVKKEEMADKGQKQPLVSIIVPVYNVHAYIDACVESLFRQTYMNLEIILVDDGSVDGSAGVCDAYADRDGKVQVVHQTNGGPSAARNTGLDRARGEYIAFVDGDDVVSPYYIEELYQLLIRHHADIAACAYVRGKDSELQRHKSENTQSREKHVAWENRGGEDPALWEICMDAEKMLRQWHGRYKQFETVVWNKLYHKSIFNGDQDKCRIRYPLYRRDEDIMVSHLLIQNADRIVLTSKKLYFYRCRPGSLTDRTVMAENVRQNLGAQRERLAFFRGKRYWMAYLKLLKGYGLHVLWFWWRRG